AQRPVDVLNYSRIQATPLALATVLALLAMATVAHLLLTSIRRRRRDLAVLKALGFVRSQVFAAVAWQATTLVGLALLVGLPLGVAAGRWTWQVFAGRLGASAAPPANPSSRGGRRRPRCSARYEPARPWPRRRPGTPSVEPTGQPSSR